MCLNRGLGFELWIPQIWPVQQSGRKKNINQSRKTFCCNVCGRRQAVHIPVKHHAHHKRRWCHYHAVGCFYFSLKWKQVRIDGKMDEIALEGFKSRTQTLSLQGWNGQSQEKKTTENMWPDWKHDLNRLSLSSLPDIECLDAKN